jgi:uncharacterized protein (DUF58 family)
MHKPSRDYLIAGKTAGARYALAAPKGAPLGPMGTHLANRPGSSLEFMDHRAYHPGDDLRHIDWAAFARTDRLSVKLFQQEINPHVDLLLDGSRSMDLDGTAKAEAALGLAGLLATAAERAGFAHRAWLGTEAWRLVPNSAADPAAWGPIELDAAPNPDAAALGAPPRLAPRGMRFLLSDLLWLGDPAAILARLADDASRLAVIQVLARDDADPPPTGNTRLVDCETGQYREIFADAAALERYRHRLGRHQQHWHRAARQVGALVTTVVAEDLVATGWELQDLVAAGILEVSHR